MPNLFNPMVTKIAGDAKPVQWYEEGVPGWVLTHPFPVGGALAAAGYFSGHRWLMWVGLAVTGYAVLDLVNTKGIPFVGFSR